ncbi:MAG TPA: DUF6279 family lipoprotein [Aquabacterium sp.]|uniref:DUF6279 family lipoprotein n=1 Tax=Aquabacterium sp. TaxID=1872578 RepID=UPI002E2FAD82|nr:DUF6279 family lipoprotein [Aquabacterium sp.]HEX5372752.1 DUF6279 family lipoprotein [Aquabacterium sp.]
MSACSVVQVVYNQAPNYVYWRMNSAMNLDDAQQDVLRSATRGWFAWNRSSQLPLMARFLMQARQDALGDITPELACRRREEMESWARAAIDRASMQFARVAVSLSGDQIDHLRDHFVSLNEDFVDDYLPEDPQERREAADKFALRWIEMFYDDLDGTQRQRLSDDIARLPFDARVIHQQQLYFQHRLLAMLRQFRAQHVSAHQAEPQIRALLMDMVAPTDPVRQADMARWIAAGCQMAASVHNRSTEAQRRHASERFRRWQSDLLTLSGAAS